MQQNSTISLGINSMFKGGFLRVHFDVSSSKNAVLQILWNYDKQSCSFTGKEKDEETGYGYFGARYMDHELLTSFMSVDRYADKYPSISPYAYCAWNPVRLIDPTGDTLVVKEDDSQRDIRNVAGKYGSRIVFNGNGIASINYSGLNDNEISEMNKHKGVAILKDLIESDKWFLYEASDLILSTSTNGIKNAKLMDSDNNGVANLSKYGRDSNGGYSSMPQEGYDGQVTISLSGRWTDPRGFDARIEVVTHELTENYARTALGKDYRGSDSAHRYAQNRMNNLHESYKYKPGCISSEKRMLYQKKVNEYYGY